ncbi:MAG: prepilin-type N-terminal cleavage/methylation domain-containing protein, partial [Verrucomicrobiota bacterium]|nr:prepilin-type N-terminal cleavage/methylation domain-containing protein [Verrucomicrobiota bacterium]
MNFCSKKGFTLIELMVVIAIIGILAAALLTPISNARDMARALRCKTHLRNLAQATLSYVVDSQGTPRGVYNDGEHRLPSAGTYEVGGLIDLDTLRRVVKVRLGWVSGGYSTMPWPMENPILEQKVSEDASYFFFDDSKSMQNSSAFRSLTNGVLWSYVSKDPTTYVC